MKTARNLRSPLASVFSMLMSCVLAVPAWAHSVSFEETAGSNNNGITIDAVSQGGEPLSLSALSENVTSFANICPDLARNDNPGLGLDNPGIDGNPGLDNPGRGLDNPGLNVTPSAVPVPAAAWLFGSGLLGLVAVAKRKYVNTKNPT